MLPEAKRVLIPLPKPMPWWVRYKTSILILIATLLVMGVWLFVYTPQDIRTWMAAACWACLGFWISYFAWKEEM